MQNGEKVCLAQGVNSFQVTLENSFLQIERNDITVAKSTAIIRGFQN